MQLEIALLGLLQAIVVAVIAGLFARDSRKQKAAHDESRARDALREQENLITMRLMSANMSLSVASAVAIKEGKVNGTMENALDEARKAESEFQDFLKSAVSRQLAVGNG